MSAKAASNSEAPDLEYVSVMVKAAQDNLFKDNYLAPVFIQQGSISTPPVVMVITGDAMDRKDELNKHLTKLVEDSKPSSYMFMSEAWATHIAAEDKDEAMTTLHNINEAGGLTTLPRKERDEVVVISLCDRRQAAEVRWMGTFLIIKGKDGTVHNFGPVNWIKFDSNDKSKYMEGRFVI